MDNQEQVLEPPPRQATFCPYCEVEVTPENGHVVFVQRDYQDDEYIEDVYRCTVTTESDNTFGWGWVLKPRAVPPVE